MLKHFLSIFSVVVFFTTVLTSCHKIETQTISGTLFGTQAEWDEVGVSYDLGETDVAKAPLSNGKFTLKLPKPGDNHLQHADGYFPVYFHSSNKDAKVTVPNFFVSKTQDSGMGSTLTEVNTMLLVTLDILNRSFSVYQYIYADKKVTITANQDDEVNGYRIKMNVDCKLGKGWNSVVYHVDGFMGTDITVTSTIGDVPSSAVWMAEIPFINLFSPSENEKQNTDTFVRTVLQEIYSFYKIR